MLMRKHARICILLLLLAVGIGVLSLAAAGVMQTDMDSWAKRCLIRRNRRITKIFPEGRGV